MEVSRQGIDLELIAAFIDGRLSGADRESAVKLLAESEAAFEVYSEALRVRADLGDDKVVPLTAARRQRGARGWWMAGSLAAAAVLLIAILPTIGSRPDPLGLAASVVAEPLIERRDLATALGEGWDDRTWSVTRGGTTTAIDSSAAFRLGVRVVDFQVALASEDRPRADRLVGEIVGLLEPLSLSDAMRAHYAELEKRIRTTERLNSVSARASEVETDLGDFLQSRWFGLGKWFAAGELAARARAAEFFAAPETVRFLEAVDRGELPPEDLASLRRVESVARQGVVGEEFETIRQIFRALIERHGG